MAEIPAPPAAPPGAQLSNPYDALFQQAPQAPPTQIAQAMPATTMEAAQQGNPPQGAPPPPAGVATAENNPYDALFTQMAAQPAPPPAVMPANVLPSIKDIIPKDTKKHPTTTAKAKTKPNVTIGGAPSAHLAAPPAPTGWEVPKEWQNFGQEAYKAATGIPVLGDALKQTVEGTQGVVKDFHHNPLTAATAAVAGAPAGLFGLGDDLGAIIGRAAYGKNFQPESLKKLYLENPAIKALVKGHEGGEGLGELAGFLPLGGIEGEATKALAGAATKIPGVAKVAASLPKLVKSAAHGAAVGEGFGAIGAGGAHVRAGEGNDLGKDLKEGLPTAVIGGALGGLLGGSKPKPKADVKGEVIPKPPEPPPPEAPRTINLTDGSSYTRAEAMKVAQDKFTPTAIKNEVKLALRNEDLKNQGITKPEEPQPEPGFNVTLKDGSTYSDLEAMQHISNSVTPAPIKTELKKLLWEQAHGSDEGGETAQSPDKPKSPPTWNEDKQFQLDLLQKRVEHGTNKHGDKIQITKMFEEKSAAQLAEEQAKVAEANAGKKKAADEAFKMPEPEMTDEEKAIAEDNKKYPNHNDRHYEGYGQFWHARNLSDSKLNEVLEYHKGKGEIRTDRLKSLEQEDARRTAQHDYPNLSYNELARLTDSEHNSTANAAVKELTDRMPAEDKVPQNKPASSPPAGESSQAAVVAQGDPPASIKPLQADTLDHAPPAVPALRENKIHTPLIDEMPPEHTETRDGDGPRYVARKSEDEAKAKAGYHDIIDTHTGEIKSSSKRKLADAQATADRFNEGQSASQGHGASYEVTRPPTPVKQIMESKGVPIPADASEALHEGLTRVAESKHTMDNEEARYNAMHEALTDLAGDTKTLKSRPEHSYAHDAEEVKVEELRKANAEKPATNIEIQNMKKPRGNYKFAPGTTVEDAAQAVLKQHEKFSAARKNYEGDREAVKPEFMAARGQGLPRSINVPHKNGTINVRERPIESTAPADVPIEHVVDHSVREVKKRLPKKKGRGQGGYIDLRNPFGRKSAQEANPAVKSVLDGAEKSDEIRDWAHDPAKLTRIFTYRRSLDIVKKHSNVLYDRIWDNITKEAAAGHGIKFTPEEDGAVHHADGLAHEDIYDSPELANLSPEKLDYLGRRKASRGDSAEALKEHLDKMNKQYGSRANMPHDIRFDHEVMEQLHNALTGVSEKEGTSEFSSSTKLLAGAMHDYIFKWNLSYHALNRLDPLTLGAARVGLKRILKAQATLVTDPKVREYIGGYTQDSPIQQLRAETNALAHDLPAGVKETGYTKAKGKITEFQRKLPDIPSEAANFQDTMAGGIIQHGDEIGHPGGGVAYIKDLANGRLGDAEAMKGLQAGLQAANDVNGAGTFGLDKSPIQRSPAMKHIVQFVEQPYRVARMMKDYTDQVYSGATKEIRKNALRGLLTFAGTSVAFGGRTVLPKETDLLALNPITRPILYAVQDFLDKGNLTSLIFHRDLTDKLRYGLMPILGGTGTNVALGEVQSVLNDFASGETGKSAKAAIFFAISAALGGGGGTVGKGTKNVQDLMDPDKKKVYANQDLPIPGAAGHLIGQKKFSEVTGHKFGPLDALLSHAPGVDAKIGKFNLDSRRKALDKKKH